MTLACRSQREFVMGFQENYHEVGSLTEGRLYLTNPSNVDVNVRVVTPLIEPGLDNRVVVSPAQSTYIIISYSLHCRGSAYERKGWHLLFLYT